MIHLFQSYGPDANPASGPLVLCRLCNRMSRRKFYNAFYQPQTGYHRGSHDCGYWSSSPFALRNRRHGRILRTPADPTAVIGSPGVWRHSTCARFGDQTYQGTVRLRPAGGHFHRHSVLLGEYLAGSLVVLMLSGGEALEAYAVRSASSVLEALARRMPSLAHRKRDGGCRRRAPDEVAVGDTLVVFPHEICPVDGTVVEGHGVMDESYLTGEPYMMSKTPGSAVLSGADQRRDGPHHPGRQTGRGFPLRQDHAGDACLGAAPPAAAAAGRPAGRVLHAAGRGHRPGGLGRQRRGDPLSGRAGGRHPCPLLIAIPVAIIGSISLAARRGIIIKDPAVLEKIDTCRTAIFDKTGTLTYGQPKLTELIPGPGFSETRCSRWSPAWNATRSTRCPVRFFKPQRRRA